MLASIVGTSMTHGATTGGHRLGCRGRFTAVSAIACLAASPARAADGGATQPFDHEHTAWTLASFLARYAEEPAAGALRAGDVRIDHLDHDWSLNER
jgi:hypothetical protein